MSKKVFPVSPLVLLMGAVMVSALLLAVFSLGTIKTRHLLVEREMEKKAMAIAQGIGEQFDQFLAELENSIDTDCLPLMGRAADRDRLETVIRTLPIRFLMMLDGQYQLIYPEAPWVSNPRLAIEDVKLSPHWKNRLTDAEALEIAGNLDSALKACDHMLADAKSKREKALALNLKARVLRKRGDVTQAQLTYDQMSLRYPMEVSLDGSSLGAIAAFERAGILMEQEQDQAALKAYADLIKSIFAKKIRCTRDEILFYRESIARSVSELTRQERVETKALEDYRRSAARFDFYDQARQRAKRLKAENRLIGVSTRSFEYMQLDGMHCLSAKRISEQPLVYVVALIAFPDLRESIQTRFARSLHYPKSFRYRIEMADRQPFIGSPEMPQGNALTRMPLSSRLPAWQVTAELEESEDVRRNARIRRGVNIGMSALLLLIIGVSGYILFLMMRKEQEFSRMKTDFVSRVSHEMRSPMTTIRMIGEMFQSGKVRTETMTREYYDILVDETERLTRLINKVLDFSRMDSGRKPYEFTIREIGPIVTQAVQVFEVGARTAGYSVRLTLAPDLPPVNADADALAEVMLNLLDNAMKYSLERKDITVTADRQANWVCLSVTDHGIGIDPRQIGRIFDKFYRCEDEMTRQTQGTGVGLAIVKHIVEAHHGRIEAQSKPGEGSTFTVWLPAKGMNEK